MKLATIGSLIAGALCSYEVLVAAQPAADSLLRPPGTANEEDFLSRCVRCGKCIEVCPPQILKAADSRAGSATGTPTFLPREKACILCEDFPCITACPTQALTEVENREDVKIGVAVIDRDLCIALQGMRCEVCYRACPLIDEAITLSYSTREGDAIHSIFEPVIHADACVGCGLCEERCVVSEPHVAIQVQRASSQKTRGYYPVGEDPAFKNNPAGSDADSTKHPQDPSVLFS